MELEINGKPYTVDTKPGETLLDVLRNSLYLTGSKYGCGEGMCGACTVLLDGNPVRSCILPAIAAGSKSITTIEGLEQNNTLHQVQQAFLTVDVFQCAFCASGMILSAVALLDKNPKPSREEIVRAMDGNVCRCGTYPRIIEAIQQASNA